MDTCALSTGAPVPSYWTRPLMDPVIGGAVCAKAALAASRITTSLLRIGQLHHGRRASVHVDLGFVLSAGEEAVSARSKAAERELVVGVRKRHLNLLSPVQ